MPTDNGKVIVSLLAGATAGIVAGLLLAPETGEEARNGLRESARKWGGSLGKLAQDALAKLQEVPSPTTNPDARVSEDRTAADALFNSMGKAAPSTRPTVAHTDRVAAGHDDYGTHSHYHGDLDYDGDAGEGRHHAV